MNLRRLLAPALVVPLHEPSWMLAQRWTPQALGVGSVVELISGAMISPITGKVNEIYVKWIDVVEREVKGWLAADTPMDVKAQKLLNIRSDLTLSPWDVVREKIALKEMLAKDWFILEGPNHADLLHAVVRELGGKSKKTDDINEVIIRVVRLTTKENITMSDITEAKDAAAAVTKSKSSGSKKGAGKKSAKKSKGSKKSVGAAPRARSMSRTTGETLVPLLKKVGAPQALKLATQLANDKDLNKKDLQKLRDLVNEAAEKAREKKQGAVASTLSSANRLVRRLARR